MQDRTFVIVVNPRAMPHVVENIGKGLMLLNGKGLHSGARAIDAVLHDVLHGIHDKVLLKTQLEPADLEALLQRQLGRDFKLCTVQWID